jgi:sulfur carrier protein
MANCDLPCAPNLVYRRCNMPLQNSIVIQVNGEQKEIAAGVTVTTLLDQLGLKAGRVAIEYNRSILPRMKWANTAIAAGDQFEIVQFVGGG